MVVIFQGFMLRMRKVGREDLSILPHSQLLLLKTVIMIFSYLVDFCKSFRVYLAMKKANGGSCRELIRLRIMAIMLNSNNGKLIRFGYGY